jgi:DNA gyrase subunit A
VRTYKITTKTGKVVAARFVSLDQELLIISTSGIIIRMPVRNITVQGRDTQGVNVMNLDEGDRVASIAYLDRARKDKGQPHQVILDGASKSSTGQQ